MNQEIIMSHGSPIRNPESNQGVFAHLPREIIIDILVRLPIRTIISCKCVCKSWLRLVESPEFVKSHLSRSVPILAIFHKEDQSNVFRIFEIEDRFNGEHLQLFQNPLTKFNFSYHGWFRGSTNGLIFLCDNILNPHGLYVLNPITRDFITLYCPQEFTVSYCQEVTYGFGMSKITCQLKFVRICRTYRYCSIKFDCHVYTLGTRSWRRGDTGAPLMYGGYLPYGGDLPGAFVNGNLHWLMLDVKKNPWIYCFDLEAELFSSFTTPIIPNHDRFMVNVLALGDSLCICDNTSIDEIVIWSMKEYGVESSWRKEFVISRSAFSPEAPDEPHGFPFHINFLKDGEILIGRLWGDISLFYYSKKDAAARKVDMFEPDTFIDFIVHTPSLLSLRSFPMEDVSSF